MKEIDIWVDGSYKDNVLGCSIYYIDKKTKQGTGICKGFSCDSLYNSTKVRNSATAEYAAVLLGILWAGRRGYDLVRIHYDCRSVINVRNTHRVCKGARDYLELREELIKKYNICVSFRKVKGHSRIIQNNFADCLAKTARDTSRCNITVLFSGQFSKVPIKEQLLEEILPNHLIKGIIKQGTWE